MFHKVSIKWFSRTQYIPSIGLFYKEVGRLWRVSDCEELSGFITWRMSDCEKFVRVNSLYNLRIFRFPSCQAQPLDDGFRQDGIGDENPLIIFTGLQVRSQIKITFEG